MNYDSDSANVNDEIPDHLIDKGTKTLKNKTSFEISKSSEILSSINDESQCKMLGKNMKNLII